MAVEKVAEPKTKSRTAFLTLLDPNLASAKQKSGRGCYHKPLVVFLVPVLPNPRQTRSPWLGKGRVGKSRYFLPYQPF